MKVGFIGLGRMGSGMARNLLRAGHDVTVYNRTPERSRALAADGAKVAATVAEACRVDVLITMLANDAAVEDVVLGPDGVVSHLRAGALHISSSTIGVALCRRLADAHRSKRQRFVSAPVFGRPDAAAAARLYVLVAGKPAAREAAMPLLNALGQRIFVISEKPEAANLAKLCGIFLSASVIGSLGDALALVSHGASTQCVAGREKGAAAGRSIESPQLTSPAGDRRSRTRTSGSTLTLDKTSQQSP